MEPLTDDQVDALVEQHPSGMTLDQIATVLGCTRQRAQQLVVRACEKVRRLLRQRYGVQAVSDVLPE